MQDQAYLALSHARRRVILCALLDNETVSISTLLSGDTRDHSERVSLYHKHLPMLEDAGYVAWGESAKTVSRGPRFDVVRPLVAFHQTQFGAWDGPETAATGVGTVD